MPDERLSVWRSRKDVEHLSQHELLEEMVKEALDNDMVPSDVQPDGGANIYFRTRFVYNDDGTYYPVEDGYQMPVQKREQQNQCMKCEGCGKIANDEEQTPWTFWMNLPLQSSTAVLMGLVKPIECPVCKGTGKQ